MWNNKLEVVLLVIEALGTFAKVLEEKLKIIGIKTRINELQKIVFLHTGRIFQRVFEMSGVLLAPCLKNEIYPLRRLALAAYFSCLTEILITNVID